MRIRLAVALNIVLRTIIFLCGTQVWAASMDLPPEIAQVLTNGRHLTNSSEIESVKFSPRNSIIADFSEAYRILFRPTDTDSDYASVKVMTCTNRDRMNAAWNCVAAKEWRIQVGEPVYVASSDISIRQWIDKSPETALAPYVKLMARAKTMMPEDSRGLHPHALLIEQGTRTLVYSEYGSHCRTTYRIKAKSGPAGLEFRLDLSSESTLCI